jgi:enterochelin esterase family protein
MKISRLLFIVGFISAFSAPIIRAAEDDKLAGILIPGEDWTVAVQGIGFADGLSCDPATGTVYFSDMRGKAPEKPGIYSLSPDLEKTRLFDEGFSGTRPSADGKTLYAIGNKKLVSLALPHGSVTLLADKIGTNDLAVTREGRIYFTGNGKLQVSMYDPGTKAVTAVDTGSIKSPNGIGLSPDQKTLIVSDYAGINVWTFAVQPDGKLADKKPAMTMKASEKKPDVANGDGLTIDSAGRAYVTTAVGLQVFSPSGELLGVLPKPKTGTILSCTLGGKDLDYLYVSAGDTIYRRKLKVRGVGVDAK